MSLAISDTDTSIILYVGEGALFPAPTGNDSSVLVLEDVNGVKEIVHMTQNLNDVLTVVRGQEGTLAAAFVIDSRVEIRLTDGFLTNFVDGGEF